MAKVTEEASPEFLAKPSSSSFQEKEKPILAASLPNVRLDRIRDLASRGLIEIGKPTAKRK